MSAEDGSITRPFGDGEHTFRLAIGQWRELQETVNRRRLEIGQPVIGPGVLVQILLTLNAWPDDIRDVIRLGLIGGGMKPDRALVLVKRHVENLPFFANSVLAGEIAQTAMFGPRDDPAGKEPTPKPETAATDEFSSPVSTASVLQ